MIKWQKERDAITTQLLHCMYDGSKMVATIRGCKHPKGKFEVRIKQAWPWHRKTLELAKRDCEFVYINCK